MFALVVSCHNLGVAVASTMGAWLLAVLGCNPRGAVDEAKEFDHLWIASAISSSLILIILLQIFGVSSSISSIDYIFGYFFAVFHGV